MDGSVDRWIDGSMDHWISRSLDRWIAGSKCGCLCKNLIGEVRYAHYDNSKLWQVKAEQKLL